MNIKRIIIIAFIILPALACRTSEAPPRVIPPSLRLKNPDSPYFYTDRADLQWIQYYPAKGFELQARTPMGTDTIYFYREKRKYLYKFNLSGTYTFKIRALTGDGGVSDWSNEVNLHVKPVLTAVTAGNGSETLVLELHPEKKDNIITSVPGRLLADIRDGDGRLFVIHAPIGENGFDNQLFYTVIDPEKGITCQETLTWPFGKQGQTPEPAGICFVNKNSIAFTAFTEYATGLFVVDTDGCLLARELLPDFLLGPEINYREGKTALEKTRVFTTEYQPVDNLLIIRGKANRENETEKTWQVSFDPQTITFTESILGEEYRPEPLLFTGTLSGKPVELDFDSRRNLVIRLSDGDGGTGRHTIFQDREGFLSPVSLQIRKIIKSDPKTLYLSAEFTKNGKIYPICIFIRPGESGEPDFARVSVPDSETPLKTMDLRILDSSAFPGETSLNRAIQGKWKGIDESGNQVFFQPGDRGIARIDYSAPGVGDGGFARWEILWKNGGNSQIILAGPGNGGAERKVVWEIIGRSDNEMVVYDLMNSKYVYLYRLRD